MLPKILILIALVISAKCLYVKKYRHPTSLVNFGEHSNILENDSEDNFSELSEESVYPGYLKRVTRQTDGGYNSISDSILDFNQLNKLLSGDVDNNLSSTGLVHGTTNGASGGFDSMEMNTVNDYVRQSSSIYNYNNNLADLAAMANLNSITEPPPVKIVTINPLFINWSAIRPRVAF